MAVDVGVDGNVGNQFHYHEGESGDVQDGHQVGALLGPVDAVLIVEQYFLKGVKI